MIRIAKVLFYVIQVMNSEKTKHTEKLHGCLVQETEYIIVMILAWFVHIQTVLIISGCFHLLHQKQMNFKCVTFSI